MLPVIVTGNLHCQCYRNILSSLQCEAISTLSLSTVLTVSQLGESILQDRMDQRCTEHFQTTSSNSINSIWKYHQLAKNTYLCYVMITVHTHVSTHFSDGTAKIAADAFYLIGAHHFLDLRHSWPTAKNTLRTRGLRCCSKAYTQEIILLSHIVLGGIVQWSL